MAHSKRPSYLKNRNGIWYFQRGIPKDVKASIGKKMWQRSLKTSDERVAQRLAHSFIVETDGQIERARMRATVAQMRATAESRIADLPADERGEIEEAGGFEAFLRELEASRKQYAFLAAAHSSEKDDDGLVLADRRLREIDRQEWAQSRGLFAEVQHIIDEKVRTLSKLEYPVDAVEHIVSADEPGLNEILDDWASKTDPPEQTEQIYRYAIRRFIELHGDLPISDVKREHLSKFAVKVAKLPNTTRSDVRNLPIEACIAKGERKGLPTITERTCKRHVTSLKTMMKHALNEGIVDTDHFAGFRLRTPRQSASEQNEAKRQPFSPDDLNSIILAMEARGLSVSDDEYWIPFVALYQGTRQEETCQLETADIFEKDDIYCMEITDKGQGDKKVKNPSSVRTIPIHPKLVEMGFLEHVNRSINHRVFPTLKPDSRKRLGGPYGKRFSRLLKKNAGIDDRRKTFHSFRHTWTDAARNADVDTEIRMRLEGRENRETGSEAGYGTGHSIPVLYKALAKVDPFAR